MKQNLYDLEILISKILRYGVMVAGALIFAGWIGQFQLHGDPFAAFRSYHHEPLRETFAAALRDGSWSYLVCYVGLLVLVALPFTRVVMTMVLFFKQKDYILAGVSLFVCLALLVSFMLGATGG